MWKTYWIMALPRLPKFLSILMRAVMVTVLTEFNVHAFFSGRMNGYGWPKSVLIFTTTVTFP